MFFSLFINLGFASGLIVGAIAGSYAFAEKFGLLTNLLIMVAPSTLLMSLFGLPTGARYATGLTISFIIAAVATSGQILTILPVSIGVGLCSFAIIALVELIEWTFSIFTLTTIKWEKF